MLERTRRPVRVRVTIEVTLESEHNFYTGFLQNLSTGGLFVATHDLHSTGAELEVQFTLPDQPEPCEAVARVRWLREVDPGSEMPSGMGLEFVDVDGGVRDRIESFISQREPIFYED
jgi:uncharacterized protein (TIGR02266 family)